MLICSIQESYQKQKFIKEESIDETTALTLKIVGSLLLIIATILGLIYSCCKDDAKDTETVAGITATTVP